MNKTSHQFPHASFDKCLASILAIEPRFVSATKGRKGDKFDVVLYDEENEVTGRWTRNSRLAIEQGWAKQGSRLEVIRH